MQVVTVFFQALSGKEWKATSPHTQQLALNKMACRILSDILPSLQEVLERDVMWFSEMQSGSISFFAEDEFTARAIELVSERYDSYVVSISK